MQKLGTPTHVGAEAAAEAASVLGCASMHACGRKATAAGVEVAAVVVIVVVVVQQTRGGVRSDGKVCSN